MNKRLSKQSLASEQTAEEAGRQAKHKRRKCGWRGKERKWAGHSGALSVFCPGDCPCHPPALEVRKTIQRKFLSFGLDGETFWWKMHHCFRQYFLYSTWEFWNEDRCGECTFLS